MLSTSGSVVELDSTLARRSFLQRAHTILHVCLSKLNFGPKLSHKCFLDGLNAARCLIALVYLALVYWFPLAFFLRVNHAHLRVTCGVLMPIMHRRNAVRSSHILRF